MCLYISCILGLLCEHLCFIVILGTAIAWCQHILICALVDIIAYKLVHCYEYQKYHKITYLMTPASARVILAVMSAKLSEDCLPTHARVVRDELRRWLSLRKPTITLSMLKQTAVKAKAGPNSFTMTNTKPLVDRTSQMDGGSGVAAISFSAAVRPVVSRQPSTLVLLVLHVQVLTNNSFMTPICIENYITTLIPLWFVNTIA